mgnify:FL=1
MKKKSFRIFYRFILTYVIVILFLVLCLLPVYKVSLNNLKEKEIANITAKLETGIDGFEQTFIDLTRVLIYLNNDLNYKYLVSQTGAFQAPDYLRVREVHETFTQLMQPIYLANNSFVVFHNNHIAFDMNRIYFNEDLFYGTFLKYVTEDFDNLDGFREHFNKPVNPSALVLLYNRGKADEFITLHIAVNKKSSIYTLIDKESLLPLFFPSDMIKLGYMKISDADHQTVFEYNPKEYAIQNDESCLELLDREINLLGLKITIGVPEAIYEPALQRSIAIILTSTIIAIFLSTLLSFAFAYRNSVPIVNLVKEIHSFGIGNNDSGLDHAGRNEFEYLHHSFTLMNHNQATYLQNMEDYKGKMKSRLFEDLLKGYIVYDEKKFIECDLLFYSMNCFLLFSAIENAADVENICQEQNSCKRLPMEKIQGFLPEDCMIYEIDNRYITAVIPYGESPFENYSSIEIQMEMVLHTIQKQMDFIPVGLAVSKEFQDPNQLFGIYHHAKNILEKVTQENPVVFLNVEQTYEANKKITPVILSRIYDLLLAGKEKEVNSMFSEIFLPSSLLSLGFKQSFYSVRGVIIQAVYKLFLENEIAIPDFEENKTNYELLHDMLFCCQTICRQVNGDKRSHNDEMREEMLTYINTHHQDPQLCISILAQKFNVNEKYVSQFIKEQMGKTYSEYLESVRLEHALILLKNSRFGITQIAMEVGFTSQNTFYKAFRRVYHVSPSSWRRTYLSG